MPSLRLLGLAATLFALPLAAAAFELDIVNQSSLTVTGVSLYPLDAGGEPVEDNLGGRYEPLAPGAETRLEVSAQCGSMLVVVAVEAGDDLRLKLDTCNDRSVVVRD